MSKWETGKNYHVALSVDVDRFPDRTLRRYCKGILFNGQHPTVVELRAACADARAKGFRVFPPCDHTEPDGSCAGHHAKPDLKLVPDGRPK